MERDEVSGKIVRAAIEVHRELGPGLLESAYEACLAFELMNRGLRVERQKPIPVVYKGIRLDCGYRMDLLIEDSVVVELKAVEKLERIHTAIMITYLKLSGHSLGLIFNFNEPVLITGIRRVIHDGNGHIERW
jgi:GxxExxY protein